MNPDWPCLAVRDLVRSGVLERPIDGNHGELHPKGDDFVNGGVPFIMASDLIGGRVDTKHCAFITEKLAKSLRKGFAQTGDVLISHKATIGRTAIVRRLDAPFLMLTPQVTYYRVIDESRLDPRYLRFYFDSPKFQSLFAAWARKGSTRDYLGITAQLDLPILVPPIANQRVIANVLGALEDKIELNRSISATLEAMARVLFKSWFVDFDPVRAKAEGRNPGFPPEIAALFPDSFENSERGEIPIGWDHASLLDIAKLNPEIWSSKTRPEVVRYVDLTSVKWGRFDEPKHFLQSQAPSRAQRVLRPGDTIVGTVRPGNGSYGLVADGGLTGSTGFAVLRPTKSVALTYLAATSKENIERLSHLADGGAYPAVRPEAVAATILPIGPDKIVSTFEAVSLPLLERASHTERESRTLAALRDALLPKLISGEIRVGEAERMVGEPA